MQHHIDYVRKRDGSVAVFDASKISSAIARAGTASGEFDAAVADKLTMGVVAALNDNTIQDIERIQDLVELALWDAGYTRTARAYIVYREQHARLRDDRRNFVHVASSVGEYLDRADWRVNANANQGYSLGGLILNSAGKMIANYWLNHVYPPAIGERHIDGDVHIHDLDFLAGYCAGWSLRMLLQEGLNGVPGKIEASPPRHMSSAVGQIVNFLGALQNEWAGAQAFSSFDTYMAPFVRVDNLNYDQVKQNIQELIYNLNVPSRWGCVDADTEVLSTTGFKKYNELQVGDSIYSWDDGKLVISQVNYVTIKEYTGTMHSYLARGYNQTVTTEHRVLTKDFNSNSFRIRLSQDIFDVKTPYSFPANFPSSSLPDADVSNDEIVLAAMIYTDGAFDYRGDSIHKITFHKSPNRWGGDVFDIVCKNLNLTCTQSVMSGQYGPIVRSIFYGVNARIIRDLVHSKQAIAPIFMNLSAAQADLFLKTWAAIDGDIVKFKCQYDNDTIRDQLQHIAVRAGYTSHLVAKKNKSGKLTQYIKIRQVDSIAPKQRTQHQYTGIVWCPSVDTGTAVFRKDGSVFISGQSQSPFSNLTFDWVCPEDLKNRNPLVGGEEMPFTYGDLQAEMDMINRAYIEVMTVGDYRGRVFTFPIPTYNITNDFPWDSDNAKLLFEMTAKYGLPYFQNFLSSDLKPHMVRSMCCRLQLDLSELLKRGNGLFGSAEQTGCYDDSTEVYTNNGWKLFKDVTTQDTTLSMNSNGIAELIDIDQIHEYDFDGNLISFKAKGIDLLVTPNHRMVTISHGKQVIRLASDVKNLASFDIPFHRTVLTGNSYSDNFILPELETPVSNRMYDPVIVPYDIWACFMGIYLSEGSCDRSENRYRVVISQTKQKSKKAIKSLLNLLPFHYAEDSRGFEINHKPLNMYLRQFGLQSDRFIPDDLKSQPSNVLSNLIDWLMLGDGNTHKVNGSRSYWTISKRLANDLQEVMLLNGKNSSIKEIIKKDCYIKGRLIPKENQQQIYVVHEMIRRSSSVMKHNITEVPYNGKVYCLTVKHGTLLVRRNGKISWCGNSIGVVTINCARLGYVYSSDWDKLIARLGYLLELARDSLEIKRKVIQRHMDDGLFPYTKRYLGTLRNHFSTIGVNGINEMIRNFTGGEYDITTEYGHSLAANLLDHVRARMVEFQESTGHMYNLEATPAEGACFRFAKEDQKRYPDILQAGTREAPYYTNSSQLPVGYTSDAFLALEMQEDLQAKYTGGTVLHLYMGERMGVESCKKLVRRALERFRIPYLTISPTFSICPEHGYLSGEHEFCPLCDEILLLKKRQQEKCCATELS